VTHAGPSGRLATALILMSFTISRLKASLAAGEATESTLLEITSVDSRLLDSDGVLNGYVISADPWFAHRIELNRSDFRAAMAKLGNSVDNDPELYDMYLSVKDRLAKRQAYFEYLAQPQHRKEVANVARSPAAQSERNLTDELHGRLRGLLRAERAKRNAQHTDMIHESQKSYWIAVGVVILFILSGAINLLLANAKPARL
jgi:hypothetical protein